MNDIDIEDMLRKMGSTNFKRTKTHIMCDCPFAPWSHERGSDSHASFSVLVSNTSKSVANCFACHESGTLMQIAKRFLSLRSVPHLIEFVKEHENYNEEYDGVGKGFGKLLDLRKALWLMSDEEKKDIWKSRQSECVKVFDENDVKTVDWKWMDAFMGSIPKYVLSRGITMETAKTWRLGYNKSRLRVMMPIIDRRNRLVGYAQRSIQGKEPKYLFNHNFDKEFFLYGENLIDPGRGDIVLVEGQFDALKVYQAGFNVVAILGSYVSMVQARKLEELLSMGAKIVLMFDGDKAGRNATELAYEMLKDKVTVVKRMLSDGTDPDLLTEKQIKDMILKNEYK